MLGSSDPPTERLGVLGFQGKNPIEAINKNTSCVALGMTVPSLGLVPLISKIHPPWPTHHLPVPLWIRFYLTITTSLQDKHADPHFKDRGGEVQGSRRRKGSLQNSCL